MVVAVLRAEAEILGDPSAALLDGGVEDRLEPVAIGGMEELEPVAGGSFQRTARQAKEILGLGTGEDAVALHVPVPDDVAGAGQRQRAALACRRSGPA